MEPDEAHARRAVALRWLEWLRTDADGFEAPGIVLTGRDDLAVPGWGGYAVAFCALRPTAPPRPLVVTSSPAVCDHLSGRLRPEVLADDERLLDVLLTAAQSLECEDAYTCDVFVGWRGVLRLPERHPALSEHPPGDPALRSYDGRLLSGEVDGPIFTIEDDTGLLAWAGIKRSSPAAQDMEAATRPDARRRGLGRHVVAAATQQLLDEGITPFYACLRTNTASAALARSLGFQHHGLLVLAETRKLDAQGHGLEAARADGGSPG